ncbi:hypothetical protein AB0O67_08970 [Streptomyces sp. NPDC086077]|uniref:hypothetical protein n=1 Tax=Streptomyces sp. NPDC086077 TaxID=3154862 RepID=UPI00343DAD38
MPAISTPVLTGGGFDIGGPVFGNPDEGWRHLVSSTAPEADPAPGAPAGRTRMSSPCATGVGSARTRLPSEQGPRGPTVRTEAFTALIGDAAADAHGTPELTLEPC